MPSCITYDKCVDKYGITGDTTYVPYTVVIPKDSIITIINIDSVPYLIPGEVHYIDNPQSRVTIKYWKDKYLNAINVQAICDSIVIHDTIPCPPTPVLIETVSEFKQAWYLWGKIAAILLPMMVIFVIYLIIKFKK